MREVCCVGVGAVLGYCAELVSGVPPSVSVLLTMMVLDFLTGVMDGLLMKSDKTEGGGISSKEAFRGIVKKLSILIMVAAATMLSRYLETASLQMLVIDALIASEGLSLVENLGLAGCPIPQPIKDVLETLKRRSDNEN